MIHVHLVPNALEPGQRESHAEAWRPGLTLRELAPAAWRDDEGLMALRAGRREESLDAPVEDGEHVVFARAPGDLSTASLIFLLVFTTFLSRLLAPKLPIVELGDERSPTYGFSGIKPTRSEGTPITTVYGRMRCGGQVIGEFVESRGPLGSWYNVLICFGYGPVRSICGVTADTHPDLPLRSDAVQSLRVPRTLFVNDTPATDYDGVELHVRLGTAEQLPIPGFNLDEQTITIGTALTGADSTGTAVEWMLPFWPLSPGGTSGAELTQENATWAAYGVAQSILDRDVDHFTVVAEYPAGLYTMPVSGNPYEWSTSIAIRYIELDGGGAPITTGGTHGDGYVRLRPTPLYRADVQGPFSLDFAFPFYDPQTYTLPTRSALASFNFENTFTEAWMDRSGGLTYPGNWAAGSTTAPLSVEAWVVLRPNGGQTGSTSSGMDDTFLQKTAPVVDLLDTTTKRGFRLVYRLQQFQIAPGQLRSRIVPVVQVGDGSVIKDYYEHNPSGQTASAIAEEVGDARWRGTLHQQNDAPTQDYAFVAFTYQPAGAGTLDVLRLYADGEIVLEVEAAVGLMLPATATPFELGRRAGSTSVNQEYFKGHMDEVVVWRRALTSEEVRQSFNSGFGTYHSTDADVVAGYHFEDGTPPTGVQGNGQTVLDFGPLANHLTTRLNPTGGTASNIRSGSLLGIMERQPATNTIKRSRYRVEVMRALKDVTTTNRVDDVRWAALRTHVDEQFSYPGLALAAVRIRAQDQLSGSKPAITAVVEGVADCPVWDGASTSAPTFTKSYSRSPAWVLADVLLHPRRGLGQYYSGKDLVVESFQELADYSDELIYDLRGDRQALDDVAGPITNLVFDGSQYGGLGRIEVQLKPGVDPPEHLQVGGFVGFHGAPDPATYPTHVFQDVNVGTVDGFEIKELRTSAANGGAGGLIRVQYQRDATTTRANPPWGGAGDLLVAINPNHLTGVLEGREERFRFDGVLDQTRPAADWLQNIITTCRTLLLREGRRVRLRVIKPEPVSDLVGQSQVQRDSFSISYASPKSRPNAYDASIVDESILWDRSVVPSEDASVTGAANLAVIRRQSVSYEGITRRSQAVRMLQFLLASNRLSLRSGKIEGSIDGLANEVGDVVQVAHDVVPRGTSGRVFASASSSSVVTDRRLVLAPGKTYDLAVRTSAGTFQVRTISSAAGTYAPGVDALTVSSPFTIQPEKGQALLVCEQGKELLVRLTRASLTQDLRRAYEWVEYSPDAFAVEEFGDVPDLPQALVVPETESDTSSQRLPANVEQLRAVERAVRVPGGSIAPHVALSWSHPAATRELVAESQVYRAVGDGPWVLAATAHGATQSVLVRLPDSTPGTRYRFAIVPISRAGNHRTPATATVASLRVLARSTPPTAPTALSASMSGTQAVYEVEPGAAREGAAYELRVGGWVLGQPLARIPAGETRVGAAPWLLAAVSAAGVGAPTIYARAVSADGLVSRAVALTWTPQLLGFQDLSDLADATLTQQAWEDFSGGWTDTTIPLVIPNTTLSNLQINAAGELEFAGSALEGYYETTDSSLVLATSRIYKRELVHVSAFAVARQVHPLLLRDATFRFDDPADQMTFEGPASDLGDPEDLGSCRLWIQMRLLDESRAWGDWQDYHPGEAALVAAQFRLYVSRPSTDFQVRVSRFSTRLVRIPRDKHVRSPFQVMLQGRALRRV